MHAVDYRMSISKQEEKRKWFVLTSSSYYAKSHELHFHFGLHIGQRSAVLRIFIRKVIKGIKYRTTILNIC